MNDTVDYYFDYGSPYSYLADSQMRSLDATVRYRPILVGGLFKALGTGGPAQLAPRGEYMFADVQRWADHYGIPFRMNPGFPINTLKALRIALVAEQDGWFDAIHERLFAAMWQDGCDIADDQVLRGLIDAAGKPTGDILERISADEIKAKLRANTEEAIERGVFGVPTFFVGDVMYFGNDRLDFVRRALVD